MPEDSLHEKKKKKKKSSKTRDSSRSSKSSKRHNQSKVETAFAIGDSAFFSGSGQNGAQAIRGVVKFVGSTDFAEGDWLGIELINALGKNDGSIHGKRYFCCEQRRCRSRCKSWCSCLYGVFVRPSFVQKDTAESICFPRYEHTKRPVSPADRAAAIKFLLKIAGEKEDVAVMRYLLSEQVDVDVNKVLFDIISAEVPIMSEFCWQVARSLDRIIENAESCVRKVPLNCCKKNTLQEGINQTVDLKLQKIRWECAAKDFKRLTGNPGISALYCAREANAIWTKIEAPRCRHVLDDISDCYQKFGGAGAWTEDVFAQAVSNQDLVLSEAAEKLVDVKKSFSQLFAILNFNGDELLSKEEFENAHDSGLILLASRSNPIDVSGQPHPTGSIDPVYIATTTPPAVSDFQLYDTLDTNYDGIVTNREIADAAEASTIYRFERQGGKLVPTTTKNHGASDKQTVSRAKFFNFLQSGELCEDSVHHGGNWIQTVVSRIYRFSRSTRDFSQYVMQCGGAEGSDWKRSEFVNAFENGDIELGLDVAAYYQDRVDEFFDCLDFDHTGATTTAAVELACSHGMFCLPQDLNYTDTCKVVASDVQPTRSKRRASRSTAMEKKQDALQKKLVAELKKCFRNGELKHLVHYCESES